MPRNWRDAVHRVAVELTALDMDAHKATKLRARRPALDAIHAAIEADSAAYGDQEPEVKAGTPS